MHKNRFETFGWPTRTMATLCAGSLLVGAASSVLQEFITNPILADTDRPAYGLAFACFIGTAATLSQKGER